MRHKKLSRLKKAARRLQTGAKPGYKAAGVTGTIGVAAATLVGATGTTIGLVPILIGCGVTGLVGIVTALARGGESFLASAVCEKSDESYVASFCTDDNLSQANEWTFAHYGDESVSSDVAIQWRLRNPKAFVALTNQRGELCASFGLIGIRQECVEIHMRGDVIDSELRSSDVLSLAETKKSASTYISGVIVRDSGSPVGHRRTSVMIWAMLMYAKRVLGLARPRTLYAIAVTKQAKVLLSNLGFGLRIPGSQRRDKCDLFTYELTADSWAALLARIGDQSPMCKLEFARARP